MVLGDLTSLPGSTRWLGHLKTLQNVFNNLDKFLETLDNDLYAAAELKPIFTTILERAEIMEAMIKVLMCIEKPLIKLQVS